MEGRLLESREKDLTGGQLVSTSCFVLFLGFIGGHEANPESHVDSQMGHISRSDQEPEEEERTLEEAAIVVAYFQILKNFRFVYWNLCCKSTDFALGPCWSLVPSRTTSRSRKFERRRAGTYCIIIQNPTSSYDNVSRGKIPL